MERRGEERRGEEKRGGGRGHDDDLTPVTEEVMASAIVLLLNIFILISSFKLFVLLNKIPFSCLQLIF